MRKSVIWSFLSLVALATGALAAGCDGDVKLARSAEGESCSKTADCDDGLKCVQDTCYRVGGSSNNAAGEGAGGAGTIVGPPPPVLGGPGESCTKRADCEDGLACLSQRCTMDSAGQGGEGTTGPVLGGPGETCGLTSDCKDGLRCLPNGYNNAGAPDFKVLAAGSNSVGVCTPLDSGLVPSGKTCGHECVEAADCCELPVAAQATLGAYSCSDLAAIVADVPDCATALGTNGAACLAYNSYCDGQCGKNTWSCEAGACKYTAKCTKATEVVGGCPPYTRGGNLVPACDVKAGKCETPAVPVVGCTSDAKCDAGLPVYDRAGDTCSKGECTCQVETGHCFRKCSEDLDCAAGYVCDAKSTLCVPQSSCSSDVQCAVRFADSRAKCVDGSCTPPPCEHDIDCNPYGLTNGNFYSVCNADKKCVSLSSQCESNDECSSIVLGGGVRSFCAEPVAGTATPIVTSAITD